MRDLDLEDRILMTTKNSVAAQNRFIYYPDHIVQMPGPGLSLLQNLSTLWYEPLFKGAIGAALRELTVDGRPKGLEDESIGSFISRRFGPGLADNVVSAIFHGIYAGDIYKLSARSILAGLWQLESKFACVMLPLLSQRFGEFNPITLRDLDIVRNFQQQPPMSDKLEKVKGSSVFTFQNGIGELADQIEAKLLENPNVEIRRETLAQDVMLKKETRDSKVRLECLLTQEEFA